MYRNNEKDVLQYYNVHTNRHYYGQHGHYNNYYGTQHYIPNYYSSNYTLNQPSTMQLPSHFGVHQSNIHNNQSNNSTPSGGVYNDISTATLLSNPLQQNAKGTFVQSITPQNHGMTSNAQINYMNYQQNGLQTFMNSFKNSDGTIDINKMVNTAGNVMNAFSQLSSVVKGFTTMFTK